jgi:hypothetical protein
MAGQKNKPSVKDIAKEHGVSTKEVRSMQFQHGAHFGIRDHDFEDGKHNTTCMVCGYERGDNGGADYESDRQQDK